MASGEIHICDDKLKSLLREVVNEAMADPSYRRAQADELRAEAAWTPQVGEWVKDESDKVFPVEMLCKYRFKGDKEPSVSVRQGCTHYRISGLHPATNAEVAQALGLKRGDRVRDWTMFNREGVFLEDKAGLACVQFEDGFARLPYYRLHLVSRASQPIEQPSKPEHDFVVGEVLRVRDDATTSDGCQKLKYAGRIGVVERISDSKKACWVGFSDGHKEWFRSDELHRETHAEAIERLKCGLGDKVRIVGKPLNPDGERGWLADWASGMDAAIGKVGIVVEQIHSDSAGYEVRIDGVDNCGDDYYYPAFVLELVSRAEPATAEAKQAGIHVGQTVEIVGESQYGCDECVGQKAQVVGLDDDGEINVKPINSDSFPCGATDHVLLPSSLRPITPRPFQWRDLVEIVGPDVNDNDKYIGMKAFTTSSVFDNGNVRVSVAHGVAYEFPSSSLRLLRTAEEVVKWAGGKQ